MFCSLKSVELHGFAPGCQVSVHKFSSPGSGTFSRYREVVRILHMLNEE